MQKLLKEYLDELSRKQKKSRKAAVAALLLVVMVVGSVAGILSQYGVAMTGKEKCGLEEHQHDSGCYTKKLTCGLEEREGHTHTEACFYPAELVCGLEENEEHTHTDACYQIPEGYACGLSEGGGHTHTEACYTEELTCGKEEHTHTDACYIDAEADVEEQSAWDGQYANVEWTGNWGEDLAAAARVQLGYKESVNNYTVAENGVHKGYTRYGQFAGDVYADWDAAFVNFCLHYAGIKASGLFPEVTDTAKWQETFLAAGEANHTYLAAAEGYVPAAGDLVFFRKEGEETETQMGIVSSYEEEAGTIHVIEGNSQNEVRENVYSTGDSHITAYLKLTELEAAYKASLGEAPAETEPATEAAEGENQTGIFKTETEESEGETEAETDTEKSETGTEEAESGEIPAEVLEELEESPAYEASYEDDMGTIHVAAGEGTVPEGAELSVKKIEPIVTTADLDDEEAAEVQEMNDQYELTAKKLSEESEKNNTTLEGFLAYDICFLVDGVEVEPNGPVKVTMDFKEAVKPEGVSENAVVGVNHLKEDETAEDGVVVEDLTEKTATTITTAEEEPTVEKVELVTETFSVFTVSWVLPMFGSVPMTIYHTDGQGNCLLDHSATDYVMKNVEFGEGYELEGQLQLENITKGEVQQNGTTKKVHYRPVEIKLCTGRGFYLAEDGTQHVEKTEIGTVRTVQFKSDGNAEFFDASGSQVGEPISLGELASKQYFVTVIYEATELYIRDDIKESGLLMPEYSGSLDEGDQYVWFKRVNEGEYQQVEPQEYSNGRWNVEANGGLNVGLDGGALNGMPGEQEKQWKVEYKVELRVAGQSEPVAVSAPFSVQYYNEVRNGSFEEPVLASNTGVSFLQLDQEGVVGWNTTASDRKIEIAEATDGNINGHYDQKSYFEAAEGKQFAELNATQTGSLYQDILVERGTLLHYSFAHRGRANSGNSGADQMYLLIVPTIVAEKGIQQQVCTCGKKHEGAIDTQEEVECLLKDKDKTDKDGNLIYPGVYTKLCTANTIDWTVYSGDYMPIYNLNRFFFVSTQKSSPEEGNFLDNVHFSQYLPKPEPGKFSFRINKTITGLLGNLNDENDKDSELRQLVNKLTFRIEVKDESGNEVSIPGIPNEAEAKDMSWKKSTWDNSWYGIITFDNKVIEENKYTITVTEQNEAVDSYECNTVVEKTESKEETVSEGSVPSGGQTTKTGSVEVQKNVSKGLRFTNTYSEIVVEEPPYEWKVKKCSSTDNSLMLEGAKFELKDSNGRTVATGVSKKTSGEVEWTKSEGIGENVDLAKLDGIYTLSETNAPTGYVLSAQTWTLTFEKGNLKTEALSDVVGTNNLVKIDTNDTNKTYTIVISNDTLYTLPSTGGIGTYWYLIGGTLLMLAAALILYKNKRGEVLGS